MADLIEFSNTRRVLEEYAVEFRNTYQDNLIRSDRIASGELLNTVESRVVVGNAVLEVQLTLAEYWKWVENDTRPHWAPASAILRWVRIKPVLPRPDKTGRLPSPEQLAYLINRHIAQFGTRGSHDLEKTKAAVNPSFKARLEEALALDVSESVALMIRGEFQRIHFQ